MIWEEIHPVQAVFRSMPAPRPVKCDLVQFERQPDGTPEYWTLRLYRDDFDGNTAENKLVLFNWASDVIKAIRAIQPCYVEVYERAPR